jgi:hypothetical protein
LIVITYFEKLDYTLSPGDTFNLTIRNPKGTETVISEPITSHRKINFACTYRFCKDNGEMDGFHLSGMFGNTEEMPEALRNAKSVEDLTESQRINFLRTYK